MAELDPRPLQEFDFVYHPISASHVPDVERVYAEVAKVLGPERSYRLAHWNPVHMRTVEGGNFSHPAVVATCRADVGPKGLVG